MAVPSLISCNYYRKEEVRDERVINYTWRLHYRTIYRFDSSQ